jgi:hypothetical protein
MKLKRNLKTKENREFWAMVDLAWEEVQSWPESMCVMVCFNGDNDD